MATAKLDRGLHMCCDGTHNYRNAEMSNMGVRVRAVISLTAFSEPNILCMEADVVNEWLDFIRFVVLCDCWSCVFV